MCKMTIGYRHRSERQNSRTGCMVLKNGCADFLIDCSAISSTQQEVLGL